MYNKSMKIQLSNNSVAARILTLMIFLNSTGTVFAGTYNIDKNIPRPVKCATEWFSTHLRSGAPRLAGTYAERPKTDMSYISSLGHFKIHYDIEGNDAPDMTDANENGIPDYVESASSIFEHVWYVEIDSLGFILPESDGELGGGPEVDVYIENLCDVYGCVYGWTTPDVSGTSSSSSFITIDNDYKESIYDSNGIDGLSVTAAHEFFHTIHFSYYNNYNKAAWLFESTAVWMEDVVYDDVNDYFSYLGSFYTNLYKPVTYLSYKYGACVFIKYLESRFGYEIVKILWQTTGERQNFSSAILQDVFGDDFANVLGQFAVWNYFTGTRSRPELYFKEGSNYPYASITGNYFEYPAVDSSFTQLMGSRHHRFVLEEEADDPITISFYPYETGSWEVNLIGYREYDNPAVWNLNSGEITVENPADYNWFVLVPTCILTWGSNHEYVYSATSGSVNITAAGEISQPEAFTLYGNYPNPFNPSTTITFDIYEKNPVKLSIYNSMGQEVSTLFNRIASQGKYSLNFRAKGISSGLYIIILESNGKIESRKMLLLK